MQPADIKKLKVAELKDELTKLGLPTSGKKDELAERLIAAVEARAVDPALVTAGATAEEKALNAKYAISCARKLGCTVFCLWEDVTEVNQKMMMVFVASLMAFASAAKAAGK